MYFWLALCQYLLCLALSEVLILEEQWDWVFTFLLAFLLLSVISQPNLSPQSAFLETSLPTVWAKSLSFMLSVILSTAAGNICTFLIICITVLFFPSSFSVSISPVKSLFLPPVSPGNSQATFSIGSGAPVLSHHGTLLLAPKAHTYLCFFLSKSLPGAKAAGGLIASIVLM